MKHPYTVMKDKPKEFFHLIPQTGVHHIICREEPAHNAVWDMAVSPEGRLFFSVCGESYEALYARLYEYDRKEHRLVRHFGLEEKILTNPAALRTSKFHTALSFLGDGRILSATHTTSPAPSHPTWMPYEYADHPYEGYPGSQLLTYDYNTGAVAGLGTLSPHDTVYGATYDPKNGDYFAITWMRGTGYVYNIHTGKLRCLGQISDTHTSRTFLLSDGHIYGSTYSGAMFRYNTDLREVEFLGVNAPGLIRHAREWNGVLYFTTGPCSVPGRGQELYAYELATRKLWTVGRPVPKAEPIADTDEIFYNAYGMAFDSKGRLFYGCMTYVPHHRYVGARLYMWDFLHGGEPIDCGFLGTPERTLSITAEMHIIDDVLYISDGNHTSDRDLPCGVLAIELDKFVPALDTEKRILSHDYVNYLPYQEAALDWYPKDDIAECLARYEKTYRDTFLYFEDFRKENAYRQSFGGVSAVSVWERVGRENAAVRGIEWTAADRFSFYCGKDGTKRVDCTVAEGKPTVTAISDCAPYKRPALPCFEATLPAVPGRRYLAKAESAVRLPSGEYLVGTSDTMLCRVNGAHVFSLGAVTTAGGVHDMTITPSGTVFGVAGHPLGVGQLFSYNEDTGVTLHGLIPECFAEGGRNVALFRPTTIAASPDGRYLAIGGEDEMGGVTVITL